MSLLEQAGAPKSKDAKFVPLFMDRAFTGLYTQRSPLRDPSDWATSRFYGGRPDALIDGLNIELTNRLTLQRRPGLADFSTATYPTPPNRCFPFQLTDGTIRVIVDTDETATLILSQVTAGSPAVYTGVFPSGGANAYAGMKFTVAGYVNAQNNGTFVCTASTTTTLSLTNTAAITEVLAGTAHSTGAVYYDHQSGSTKTLLFAKTAGAGQSHFIAVAGVLFIGDGVETWKYTPDNVNGEIWNWGIDTPTDAPGLTVTEAGAATTEWQASTFFSTMGIIVDSNGDAEQLVSVNNNGVNPGTQFGTSSVGGPPWNHTIGGATTDGTVTWRNIGTLLPWAATTTYSDFAYARDHVGNTFSATLFDAPSNSIYFLTSLANSDKTGALGPAPFFGKPPFNGVAANTYHEPAFANASTKWLCEGNGIFPQWSSGMSTTPNTSVVEYPLPPAPDQTAYIHASTNSGTTAASFAHPNWATATGGFTPDKHLVWVNLGSATWAATHVYTAWRSATDTSFSCIQDSNGDLQVCIQSGTSGLLEPTWATEYGSPTPDGNPATGSGAAKWVNVGIARNWNSNKAYHLPLVGFSPPTDLNPYGGSAISDSNAKTQYCTASGLSGGSAPSWDVDTGDSTTDNQITWYNNGPFVQASFTWSQGLQYVYSFKARAANDSYVSDAPPLWANALGNPTGSATGAVSSASPKAIITTGNPGAVVTLRGKGSLDPQVDTIEIFRTTDGGATFLFLTDVPNPASVGGDAGDWSVNDYMSDTPTSTLPGLNPLIQAPINGVNDPPNDAFLPMVYNFQRIWGAVGSNVYFSGGPDVLVGNPNEAFYSADVMPFLANVARLVKTSQGLVTFLTNSIELIGGGPLTSSFFSVTLSPGIGLLSYNALDVYGGEIYFFSSDGQFKMLSPQLQLSNFGFPIGDQFAGASAASHVNNWNPANVYVSMLQSGLDAAVFISDGLTGWFRCNPRQVPGGFSGAEPIWSPFAAVTGGCQMVQTVETTPGIKKLLVGATSANQKILQRDLSLFQDGGVSFPAHFVMGSIMLANPGQLAVLKFIEMDLSGVAFRPTVSFLLNEISGSFTAFAQAPVSDPPSIYGTTITPATYSPNRYYFSGNESLARCRHLQIKVDLGMNAVGSELYNLTIFGRLMVEP